MPRRDRSHSLFRSVLLLSTCFWPISFQLSFRRLLFVFPFQSILSTFFYLLICPFLPIHFIFLFQSVNLSLFVYQFICLSLSVQSSVYFLSRFFCSPFCFTSPPICLFLSLYISLSVLLFSFHSLCCPSFYLLIPLSLSLSDLLVSFRQPKTEKQGPFPTAFYLVSYLPTFLFVEKC